MVHCASLTVTYVIWQGKVEVLGFSLLFRVKQKQKAKQGNTVVRLCVMAGQPTISRSSAEGSFHL